jgi:SAM-dependent methyltransferase
MQFYRHLLKLPSFFDRCDYSCLHKFCSGTVAAVFTRLICNHMAITDLFGDLGRGLLSGVGGILVPQGAYQSEIEGLKLAYPTKELEAAGLKYLVAQWALFRLTGLVLLGGEKLFFGLDPSPLENPEQMLASRYAVLLEKDLQNAIDGVYPWELLTFPYAESLAAVPEFISDFNAIRDRMNRNEWALTDALEYPQYYRRTYHWQSDGYLSERSARLYDVSAELQLRGGANIVRRLALGCVVKNLQSGNGAPRILELASGTGRLLTQLHQTLPESDILGVELSPFYVEAARQALNDAGIGSGNEGVGSCKVICSNAYRLTESVLKEQAGGYDAIVSVFLLHELPAALRRALFAECYKLLKPGGTLVFADAVQDADDPFMSSYLRWLLARFHEPYFYQYLKAPIAEELIEAGFSLEKAETAFLAKYYIAHK